MGGRSVSHGLAVDRPYRAIGTTVAAVFFARNLSIFAFVPPPPRRSERLRAHSNATLFLNQTMILSCFGCYDHMPLPK